MLDSSLIVLLKSRAIICIVRSARVLWGQISLRTLSSLLVSYEARALRRPYHTEGTSKVEVTTSPLKTRHVLGAQALVCQVTTRNSQAECWEEC